MFDKNGRVLKILKSKDLVLPEPKKKKKKLMQYPVSVMLNLPQMIPDDHSSFLNKTPKGGNHSTLSTSRNFHKYKSEQNSAKRSKKKLFRKIILNQSEEKEEKSWCNSKYVKNLFNITNAKFIH